MKVVYTLIGMSVWFFSAQICTAEECVTNLKVVSMDLYMYKENHDVFPTTLEEVTKEISHFGLGRPAHICPVTGKPYVLNISGKHWSEIPDDAILVYDSELHEGIYRNVILKDGNVVKVKEGEFIKRVGVQNSVVSTPILTGRICYHSTSDNAALPNPVISNDGNIFVYDLISKTLLDVTSSLNVENAMNPHFSPDGKKITFMAIPKESPLNRNSLEIYVYDFVKESLSKLTNNSIPDEDSKFSPDGYKIIFKRNGQIWTMNGDGTETIKLTTTPEEKSGPYYSPDGNRIVFWRDAGANADIWWMLSDGSEIKKLFGKSALQEYYPIYQNPDKILYIQWESENNHYDKVYQYSISKGLTERLRINMAGTEDADPFPISDNFIGFSSKRKGGKGGYDVYIGNLQTGELISIAGMNSGLHDLGGCYSPIPAMTVEESHIDVSRLHIKSIEDVSPEGEKKLLLLFASSSSKRLLASGKTGCLIGDFSTEGIPRWRKISISSSDLLDGTIGRPLPLYTYSLTEFIWFIDHPTNNLNTTDLGCESINVNTGVKKRLQGNFTELNVNGVSLTLVSPFQIDGNMQSIIRAGLLKVPDSFISRGDDIFLQIHPDKKRGLCFNAPKGNLLFSLDMTSGRPKRIDDGVYFEEDSDVWPVWPSWSGFQDLIVYSKIQDSDYSFYIADTSGKSNLTFKGKMNEDKSGPMNENNPVLMNLFITSPYTGWCTYLTKDGLPMVGKVTFVKVIK